MRHLPHRRHFTDANSMLHPPADSMAEPETPSYASRSATKQYRTSPLRGAWQHAALLPRRLGRHHWTRWHKPTTPGSRLGLSAQEVSDLAQYLKSL